MIEQDAVTETPPSNFDLWSSGVWLSEAAQEFSKARRKRSVPKTGISQGWENLIASQPERRAELEAIGSELEDLAAKLAVSSDLGQRQRADVISRIYSGELIALGFPPNARVGSQPEIVPLHLVDDRFLKWTKREVRTAELVLIQVRVAKAPAKPKFQSEIIKNTAPSHLAIAPSERTAAALVKMRPGPKDTYYLAQPILAAFQADDAGAIGLSAAQLLDRFNQHFGASMRAKTGRSGNIDERTLRKHLKRYREENGLE